MASNYANVEHDVAEIAVFPMQWLPHMMTWIFGQNIGFEISELAMLMMPEAQFFSNEVTRF